MNKLIRRSLGILLFVVTTHAPLVAQTYWWNDAVFYEVFVRSFYDKSGDGRGDFKGLTEKLDYLNDGDPSTKTDLGITGIWLMPISASPSYHGYDVTNYKSIESDYGTKQDFLTFIDAAHERGIKVIVDFVLNHSSNQHPWFQKSAANDAHYRNFYRWSTSDGTYNGPWGQDVWHRLSNNNYYYALFWGGMPDLNYEYQPVKDSLFAAATFWLDDMKVDGFRCDAVKYIYESGSQLENIAPTYEFWRDFRTHYKSIKPDAMAVGEAWDATSVILNYSQGDGFDFCFEFNLADAIINAVNSNNTQGLASTVQSIYYQYPYLQFGSFLTNHDQNRVIEALGNDAIKNKLAAAIYLSLPGVPFLYYGEELGMKGKKPDEDIRRPMQWSDANHAGFSTNTPWRAVNSNYATTNVAVQQSDSSSLLNWYKKLIAIRNNEPALRRGEYLQVQARVSGVFSFLRTYEDETVLVVINTTEQDANNVVLSVTQDQFPTGTKYLQDLLNNSGRSVDLIDPQSLSIGTVKNKSASIYKTSTIVGVEDLALKSMLVYPNPVTDWLTVEVSENASKNILLFDIWGSAQPVEKRFVNGFMQMNLSALTSGVYYLTFSEGSVRNTIKIAKQ